MKYIISIIFLITCFGIALPVFSQKQDTPTGDINKVDDKKRKQGIWLHIKEGTMGESITYEFGPYKNDRKEGIWYTLDRSQVLLNSHTYHDGMLDGKSQFYEEGRLSCVGNYRGRYSKNEFDTFLVLNPITMNDTLVIVGADKGSLKHGTWQYYSLKTGKLLKVEEYQVDFLIKSKIYEDEDKIDQSQSGKGLKPNDMPLPKRVWKEGNTKAKKSLIK